MMIEARLRVRHPGCLAELLPHGANLAQLAGDTSGGLFYLTAENAGPVLERFAADRRWRVHVLRREEKGALFRLHGQLPCPHRDAEAAPLLPCSYSGGVEQVRHLFSGQHEARAFAVRDPRVRVEIEATSPALIEGGSPFVPVAGLLAALTQKQLDALRTAVDGGYYDIPRSVTTAALAERFAITRTTYDEHLRKGEQALLRQFMQLLAANPELGRAATKRRGGSRVGVLQESI